MAARLHLVLAKNPGASENRDVIARRAKPDVAIRFPFCKGSRRTFVGADVLDGPQQVPLGYGPPGRTRRLYRGTGQRQRKAVVAQSFGPGKTGKLPWPRGGKSNNDEKLAPRKGVLDRRSAWVSLVFFFWQQKKDTRAGARNVPAGGRIATTSLRTGLAMTPHPSACGCHLPLKGKAKGDSTPAVRDHKNAKKERRSSYGDQ